MDASRCAPLRRDTLPWRPPAASVLGSSKCRRSTAGSQSRRCNQLIARDLPGLANPLKCRHGAASHLAAHSSDSTLLLPSMSLSEPWPLNTPSIRVRSAASARQCTPPLLAVMRRQELRRLQPVELPPHSRLLPLVLAVSYNSQSLQCASPSSAWRPHSRDTAVCLAAGRGRSAGAGSSNSGSDSDSDSEGRFWEGEEGRQKLDEIGELRVIVRERQALEEQLLALEEQALQEEEEQGLGPDEVAKRAKARAETRSLMLRDLLEKKAQEQTMRRKEAQSLFLLGQRAYGKGVYDKCVKILEKALGNIENGSSLGGEIQLWLAMAYDANGQRRQCIDLYKRLEEGHPLPPIRKQAYELRYIAEAPKIKMSPDEILTIPILDSNSQSTQRTWSQMVRERRRPKPMKASAKRTPDVWDDLEGWEPPKWEQSPYFWVALTLWLTLVGVTLVFQDG